MGWSDNLFPCTNRLLLKVKPDDIVGSAILLSKIK